MMHNYSKSEMLPEEREFLNKCISETYQTNLLPVTGVCMGVVYYGFRKGFLSYNIKFGPVPKICGGLVASIFLTQVISYNKCVRRLIEEMPDGRVAQNFKAIRAGYPPKVRQSVEPHQQYPKRYSHLDVDNSHPLNLSDGLEDSERRSLDDIVYEDEIPLPASTSQTTSYEELRRRNREQYELSMKPPPPRSSGYIATSDPDYGRDLYAQPPVHAPYSPPPISPAPTSPNVKRTKYGDVWE